MTEIQMVFPTLFYLFNHGYASRTNCCIRFLCVRGYNLEGYDRVCWFCAKPQKRIFTLIVQTRIGSIRLFSRFVSRPSLIEAWLPLVHKMIRW